MEHGRLRGAVFPSSNILALCNNAPIVRGEGGVRTGWRSALHSDTKLNTKSGLHLLGPCVGEKARCRVGLRLSLHPAHLPSQKTNVLFMKANELAPAFPFPYSFFDPSSLSWLLSKTLNWGTWQWRRETGPWQRGNIKGWTLRNIGKSKFRCFLF